MAKMVSLTIDGKPVSVPEGTLIVNAAKQVGIDIPVFCYHPKMEPVGMCRQCLVEVGRPVVDRATGQVVMEGDKPKIGFGPKLETACTTPVSEGMQVLSQSEKAKASQKEILEFLLTSHPLDCPVCDKGGECPLQNLTMAHASPQSRYQYSEKHHAGKHVPLGDLIWLDRERCIQCARCIRFQDEIAGEPVLAFYQRGRATDIITNSEPGFDSIFSGNTSDICPVGALTTADFRFGARPWEMKAAASICPHCPVGCNVTLNTRREASSGGKVAIKRVMPRQNEAVNEIWLCDKGRFAHHYVESASRLDQVLVRRNGELQQASWQEGLQTVAMALKEAGNEAVILASGRLSNEDLFTLKGLSDSLGGKALLYTHMGGGEQTLAYGVSAGMDFSSMGKGTILLVVASDLYQEAPLWYLRIKQAARRGATLIVVNARQTKLDPWAAFVVRTSYGDEVETVQGLPGKEKIGALIQSAENLVVLYGSDGLGLEGSSALAAACAELVKAHAGKPNSGLIGVWPRANDQGAWEIGFKPAEDLAKTLSGKTVYVVAADPAGDDPLLQQALKGAKFLAVQELFLTETAKLAQVVLPARSYTECEGSYTSGERRVQRFYPAISARGEARQDFAITSAIASEIGVTLESGSPARVMNSLAGTLKAYKGITYRSLAATHEQAPLVGRGDLYYGGTTYENRQGLGVHLALAGSAPAAAPAPASLRPLDDRLLAVPVTHLYDPGVTLTGSSLLEAHIRQVEVLVHPETARKYGFTQGGPVTVNGVEARLKVDENVPASVMLLPRRLGLSIHAPAYAEIKKA
ncbi:MAG: NADH dehydrogenase (quinone) subunit G [Anaerolineales bacterium]|nr:MAG: NADH dehydrogenase (quinone) subunit G [Anaerolineales bacterium]